MKLGAPGLRGRLAISISLILLVALGVTYLAVYQGTGAELRDRTENDLEREAESLQRDLSGSPGAGPAEITAKARSLVGGRSLESNSRVILITVDGGGQATNQPELIEEEHSEEIEKAPEGYSSVDVDDVGEVRMLTRETILPGGTAATIRVGQPLAPVDEALEGLSQTFVVVGLISLLLAAGAGWLLASSATRPMRKIAGVAEGVDAGDLSARMPIAETHNDEVRRLAISFNTMLDRVESAFARQRSFVADASHDLRTPLTIIKGQLQVLSRNPDPSAEEVARVTGVVETASNRMELLIDDLLTLAQAETREGVDLERSSLEPLLVAEAEGFQESADRRIEVKVTGGEDLLIDREKLARAVSNLLANAVRHTGPEGRIRIAAAPSGGEYVIAVEDDGPGVPEDQRERIFDRFSRLEASRSSSGSGLGLAIVKAIAEAHGGRVDCDESDLGGARFRIHLPLIRAASP